MDDLSGQTIKGYRFIEKVAQGGFGVVYRALQSTVDRHVAIKVIVPQYANNPEFIERFESEARLIARLEHFHIVPLFDYWREPDGDAYLVTRWFSGGDLRARIRRGPLSVEEVIKNFGQLTQALAEAHQNGIVHRDIKPENVLMDGAGNAFLTDFGIAKSLNPRHRDLTPENFGIGTVQYSSPEQLQAERITPRSDVYSLGIMLYECLTGKYPFPDSLFKHAHTDLPTIASQYPDIPSGFDSIIQRATAKQLAARFPSVLSMAAALEQLEQDLAGGRVSAPHAERRRHPEPGSGVITTPVVTLIPDSQADLLFISHSARDDEYADRIRSDLSARNIACWVDHEHLGRGPDVQEQTERALALCTDALFILSASSAVSSACRGEWHTILEAGKPLTIALVEDVPTADYPFRLQTAHYVDLRADFDTGLRQLATHILEKRSGERAETALQPELPEYAPNARSAIRIESIYDIPSRPVKMLGRDELIIEVQTLLNMGERVLLQGLGGIGKTSLAAEIVARRISDEAKGILWLDSSDADELTLLQALAYPFNDQEALLGNAGDSQIRAVRRLLGENGVKLVVLDDIWEADVLRVLLDAIPQEIPVIITSRHRYPAGTILDVGELSAEPALSLLNHHARHAYEDEEARTLCRLLGYHPFALRIAGETLKVEKITPAELLTRIQAAPHQMAMPEGFAEAGRQSIKELLDTSIDGLARAEQEVFLAYGALFVPAATPELLALCLDADAEEVRAALENLQRRGLTERIRLQDSDITYFRIHDLVHSYARANRQIDDAGLITACREFATTYRENLRVLDAERTNLLNAAGIAHQTGANADLIAIMRALTVDGPYLLARGHDALLLTQLDNAIEVAREAGESQQKTLHYLLGKRGNVYNNRGEAEEALRCYQESLEIAQARGMADREVILLCVMSQVYSDQKQFSEAEAMLDRAHEIAIREQDDFMLVKALESQGYHYGKGKRDFEAARNIFVRQIELAQRGNDPERMYYAWNNLGNAEMELGHYDLALETLQKCLKLARGQDNHLWLAYVLASIGETHDRAGSRTKAQECFTEALELYRKIGNTKEAQKVSDLMAQAGYIIEPEPSNRLPEERYPATPRS